MARTLILTAALLATPVALVCAADPPLTPPAESAPSDRPAETGNDVITMLLDRIEKLEDRVAQLESERSPSAATRYVPVQPGAPSPAPVPDGRATAPEGSVPKSWGRFNFNGQWYYIVPLKEIEPHGGQESR